MNAKRLGLLLGLALGLVAPAKADYLISTPTVAPPNAILQTLLAGTVGGKILPFHSPVDATGNPFATAANPFAITFGTGVLLPQFASPAHFICDSGCSGAGGSAVNLTGINGTAPGATNPLFVAPGTGATFPVSAASLPLPAGAATQGTLASILTALGSPMQASGGSVTANAGTNLNTSALALESGGNLAQIVTDFGAPGAVACTTDTASCNQNQQLQRLAQRLSTINTTLGSPFQAGGSIGNASFGISGTLPAFAATPTFNLGTLNGAATAANQTSVIGPAAAGAAATNSLLAGGQFNSTPITLTNTQQSSLQVDGNGFLKVNVAAGGSSGGTSSSFSAAFPATGTAAGMSQGGNMVALTGTSGNLNVQCANCSGSGVSSADEAAFTAGTSVFAGGGGFFQTTATNNALTTGQQGMFQVTANRALFTNLRNAAGTEVGTSGAPLRIDPTGTTTQPVLLASTTITGTVAVTQSGTWNINNISGTVSLPTGAATSANQPTNAAIGSTTSGQTGGLSFGAVTTAAPAYTTAQSNPLSLTTAGALRVDGSGVTQPVSIASAVTVAQATAANLNATVVGTGTFAVQATLQASATTAIGKVDPNTIGTWGLVVSTQNSATPTNGMMVVGQFNTSPATITSGNVSPLQMDNAGNLLVNIKTGSSSGAVAQGSTTSGQTGGLIQAASTTSAPTYTTGTTNPLSTDLAGNLRVTVTSALGLAQGSTTSGQTGSLIMGAVTTAAPTYTTAQTSPISLDTSGNIRVNCTAGCGGAGTVSNASSAVATSSTNIGSVSYNYGFNGTTWDQLQVDASKFLKVNIAAGSLAANQSVNVSQINGVTPLMGNGVTGTGSQRVTIASDNTAFSVNATLQTGANVIGSLTANQSVNVAQFGGVSTATGQVAVNTAPVTATNTALVVDLRPDSPGIITLGQTTKSASVPVTVASDQLGPTTPSASLPIVISAGTGNLVTGSYCMAVKSGTMAAGLAANSPIASFRFGAAAIALLRKVQISSENAGTGFAAGVATFDLFAARSFTASDSTGNAATITGNNGKLRTSYATTGISDFRSSATATLTAGTRTLDTTPLNSLSVPASATASISLTNPNTTLFDGRVSEVPVIFAQNEGFVVQASVPATGTWSFTVQACWDEMASF